MIARLATPPFVRLAGLAGLAALAAIVFLFVNLKSEQMRAAKWQHRFGEEQAAAALFAGKVRSTAEAMRAKAAEAALAAERLQGKISEEVSSDYRARIDKLRRRAGAAAGGMRSDQGGADTGGGGAAMSGVPGAAGRVDGAAGEDRLPRAGLSGGDALIASEQAVRLEELQRWLRRQAQADQERREAEGRER